MYADGLHESGYFEYTYVSEPSCVIVKKMFNSQPPATTHVESLILRPQASSPNQQHKDMLTHVHSLL